MISIAACIMLGLFFAVGIYFAYRKYRKDFDKILPREFRKNGHAYSDSLLDIEKKYQESINLVNQIEERKHALPFPQNPEFPPNTKGRVKYQKLLKTLNDPEVLQGGLEQGIFMIISPEEFLRLMEKCSEAIKEHGGEALEESWKLIKYSIGKSWEELKAEGIDEDQLMECIGNFIKSMIENFAFVDVKMEVLKLVPRLGKLVEKLELPHGIADVVFQTLDPIFHTEELREEVEEILEHSLQEMGADIGIAIEDAFDLDLAGHLPLFTLAKNINKELKLLDQNLTDASRSIKNIGLRVGLKMSGAKAGAAIGGIFGPAGAILGGILGGIFGGVIAESQVKKEYKKAMSDYLKVAASIDKEFDKSTSQAIEQIKARNSALKSDFDHKVSDVQLLFNPSIEEKNKIFRELLSAYEMDFNDPLLRLQQLKRNPFSLLPGKSAEINTLEQILTSYLRKVKKFEPGQLSIKEILALPIIVNGHLDQKIYETPEHWINIYEQISFASSIWVFSIVHHYKLAYTKMHENIEQEIEQIQEKIRPMVRCLEAKKEKLNIEAIKVGEKTR